MSSRNYFAVSGAIFTVIALMHIWRYILDLPLQIGAWYVPRSLSLIGGIASAALAVWAYTCLRSGKQRPPVYT
jgi:hypothetical protein